MSEEVKNLWLRMLDNVKRFFSKKENIGIFFMIMALILFFCFAQNPIPGFRFPWQAKRLALGLSLQTGLLALILQAFLYLKGIFNIEYNSQKMDTKQVLKFASFFIINTAVFTTFFAIILAPTGTTKSMLDVFLNFIKEISIFAGFMGGIVLIGTKDIASIGSFVIFFTFLLKGWENIKIVSSAAGLLGWFYIVFVILGFIFQENINLKQLASDLVGLTILGKKKAVNVAEATDRAVEKGKKIAKEITKNSINKKIELNKDSDIVEKLESFK